MDFSQLEPQEYFLIKLVTPPQIYGLFEDTALMMGSLSKWVRNFIKKNKQNEEIKTKSFRILDLGCGTGIFSLYLTDRLVKAGFNPFSVGVDINPNAIETAKYNAHLNSLTNQCHFLTGDFCQPLTGIFADKYNLIISNPPYTACAPIENIERELSKEELFEFSWNGGINGNEATLRMLEQLKPFTTPGGEFALISSERIPQEPILVKFTQMNIEISSKILSNIRAQDIILYQCICRS